MARRGHGKLVFLDLVDRSGRLQLLAEEGRAGPVDLDLGDVVGAVGKPDQDAGAASRRWRSTSSSCSRRSVRRSRTRSTASPTSSSATGAATST